MKKPVYYSQKDSRWGKLIYAAATDKTPETIAASGCGPTCMAMILAEWVDAKITPAETCKMAVDLKDRTDNNGTEWEYFGHVASKYKLPMKQTSVTDEVVKALQAGALVVCSMSKGYFTKGGHFILAYGYDGNNILVNDPASTVRVKASVAVFKAQSKQYFIFTQKETKPMHMTFTAALDIIDQKVGIDKAYWLGKEKIDTYFATLIIKIAEKMKG
jgi:ABC-type bacteriocin/lantibiotic exporter with double-glycine peptidase domain